MPQPLPLVLASTSPYRRALLQQLHLQFDCVRPKADETLQDDEHVEHLVVRLAEAKARAVMAKHPAALIIGSDQSAILNGEILTKPGSRDNALQQLRAASGQRVTFHTGLCLLNSHSGRAQTACVPFTVVFRELSDAMIEYYLDQEQPYNCVGSFKSEGLGVALFERFEGEDPNALIGLPLIQLNRFLRNEGFEILS